MVDGWHEEFGSSRPEALSSMMQNMLDVQMTRSMTDNQRAAFAWAKANGDRERKHTTGVFLKRSRVRGAAPVLGVYVDSHAMATDFGVNKEIYLARLSNIGYEVSGIEFLPARNRPRKNAERKTQPEQSHATELPELDEQELDAVESMVADLPESLKARASQAILISKRRNKLENSKHEGNA